jgi:hypothetical protein
MELREPTLVCRRRDGGACAEPDPCPVLFEAPTLDELGGEVARWIEAHPRYAPALFSHATETRALPARGLAGPREARVYTGVLLVRHARRGREGERRILGHSRPVVVPASRS